MQTTRKRRKVEEEVEESEEGESGFGVWTGLSRRIQTRKAKQVEEGGPRRGTIQTPLRRISNVSLNTQPQPQPQASASILMSSLHHQHHQRRRSLLQPTMLPLPNGDGVTYDDSGRPRRFAPDGYWYHCFHANCSFVNRNAQEFSGRHLREWHTRDPTQTAEDIQRMLYVVTRARGFELQNEWLAFRNTQNRRGRR